ncbi:MAG: ATP-binding protein [Pseudomonadota bacterium]
MSLRARLGAYLLGLHLLLFVFTLLLYRTQPLLFILIEALLLASLGGGFHLLRSALEPLAYTRRFHDMLQDQDYSGRLTPGAGGELGELVALFNTLLAKLYAERLALGEQQGLLDRLLEATPSAVLVFDFDERVSLLNASALALLGIDEAKGHPLRHWIDGAGRWAPGLDAGARARCRDLLAQLEVVPLGESRILSDTDGRRYRGQRGQFFDRSFARHFLLLEELTAELESSERAAYEKLIRVLAHEVNNTVAATGSVLESLLYYGAQLGERDRADFSTAVVAVKRRNVSLGEFIERFTRVVKMPAPELRPASLKAMIDDILWLNREQCKSRGITLAWSACEEVAPQLLDRHLMEQALLNIVKNAVEAVEAMPPGAARHIHVALRGAPDGVRLAVCDSADSLGAAPAHRLFTPFFSTKKGGQGIGLLFVREVLNRHGFPHRLAASGGETVFEICFPAALSGASPAAKP